MTSIIAQENRRDGIRVAMELVRRAMLQTSRYSETMRCGRGSKSFFWLGLVLWSASVGCHAQSSSDAVSLKAANKSEKPLPDIAALMHEVEARQRQAEEVRKDYIYHSVQTEQEVDGHGAVKKTEVKEYDRFWLDGVPVEKLVKKDGRALTPDEMKKESERIDKEAAKAKERREKEDAKGKETDARGNDEVTVSRLLELGSFTNPRRIVMDGRDTIVVDYSGDPKAKTRNSFEGVIRDMTGTIWVDEEDRTIAKLEGRFVDNFKIGGGLLVSIQKGTNFVLEQKRINGEVWLPARAEGHGQARVFLFFKFNGGLTEVDSDYRKFKTSSTILPVGASVPETPVPDAPK